MLPILIFAIIATAVSASDAPCLQVKPVENLDMDALARGRWYEIARYPSAWEKDGQCTSMTYTREGNKYRFDVSEVSKSSHKFNNFTAIVTVVGNDKSGVLDFNSGTFEVSLGPKDLVTAVVDVDYDHYTLYFECEYDPVKKVQTDHIWLHGRAPTLEPQAKKKLDDFFAKNKYLDMNKLIWQKFDKESCKAN